MVTGLPKVVGNLQRYQHLNLGLSVEGERRAATETNSCVARVRPSERVTKEGIWE